MKRMFDRKELGIDLSTPYATAPQPQQGVTTLSKALEKSHLYLISVFENGWSETLTFIVNTFINDFYNEYSSSFGYSSDYGPVVLTIAGNEITFKKPDGTEETSGNYQDIQVFKLA